MYAQQGETAAGRGEIKIAGIPNREGQMLRNHLIDRLYLNGEPQAPRYTLSFTEVTEARSDLDITKSSEATRSQLTLKTTMMLTDDKGQQVLVRDLKTVTSFNVLGSEFATRITEKSARESALEDIARQAELGLNLYFAAQ